MDTAADGKAMLGIPKPVGEEFVAQDASGHAAGIMFVAPDGDILLLRRSSTEANYGGHWALPGGKAEDDEAPEAAAERECREEIGDVPAGNRRLLDSRMTPTGMAFHTYAQAVADKFVPVLNDEHSGYCWAPLDMLPAPTHPGVAQTIADRFAPADDMSPEEWADLRSGFAKWTREEEAEAEHASDAFALDRSTVRSKDADGHLRVEITPISKAAVNPYYGREIPGWQSLGLDPERVYNLYRDADELAKGAKTFAGKPLLLIHKPVQASDHPREIVIGSVGDAVVFDPPYLKAPLTIWDGEAIALIESGEQRELSSSYRYTPVMVPGIGPDGVRYDGRMTAIIANHVALVEAGRAGSDVFVQDNMPAGLAATDPSSGIPVAGVKRAAAHDQEEPEMAEKVAKDRAKDEAGVLASIKEKLSEDECKALDDMLAAGKANDEDVDDDEGKKAKDETAGKPDDEDDKAKDEEAEEEKKAAMDAAITKAKNDAVSEVLAHQRAIREAERHVRPWVGDLNVAMDSADAVYVAAFKTLGKDVTGIHPSAYPAMLEIMSKPGQTRQTTRVAMDAAKASGFAERFPDAGRIRVNTKA